MSEQRDDSGLVPEPTSSDIKRFPLETREALVDRKYWLGKLTGQSNLTLEQAGRRFYIQDGLDPQIRNLRSRMSEVAIGNPFDKPYQYISPNKDSVSIEEFMAWMKEYNAWLQGEVPGVEAVVGEVPDYLELLCSFKDETGIKLLGDLAWIITQSKDGSSRLIVHGESNLSETDFGVVRYDLPDNERSLGAGTIYCMPLILPK